MPGRQDSAFVVFATLASCLGMLFTGAAAGTFLAAVLAFLLASLLAALSSTALAGLTPFATSFPCFFRSELMGLAALMGSLAALAGNLALTLRIHAGKPASIALFATLVALVALVV
jgi:hypothetical protein